MKKKLMIRYAIPLMMSMGLLGGCGGSSSSAPQEESMVQIESNQTVERESESNVSEGIESNSTQSSEVTIEEEEMYTLTFVDSPVVNLTYECGDKIARTDSEGNLSCASFPITFSAIGVEIGELEAMTDDHRVFPQDLVGVDRLVTGNTQVRKIASFLQSLDDDGDVSRYIIIQDEENLTQSKPQSRITQKLDLPRLVDMDSSAMFSLLRHRGVTPVSLYQAEQNLRRYGLGLVPAPAPTPAPYTPPTPTPDTTPPVVTLNGDANLSLYINQNYVELNATARDDRDGNVGASITITGSVDSSTIGVYILVYRATDSAGNEGNATRTVNILPHVPTRKTGQIFSYEANGSVVSDGSQRDDGYYQKGVDTNFTRDAANEIVIDNLTGLMWQDDSAVASVTKQWLTNDNYNTCHNDTTSPACLDTSGDTATTYCADLTLGGYNDWRLPTVEELEQLLDYGLCNPALDSIFHHISSSYYWSSSTVKGGEDATWIVDFYYGYVVGGDKVASHYVRCVRDGVD